MGNFLRIADEPRRQPGIDVKHHLQLAAVLQGSHGDDIVHHRCDGISILSRRQSAFYNLRIIKDIVDLTRQPFAGQFDGLKILTDFGRDIFSQSHFADTDDHVHRGAQLMGYIGQEIGVLPHRNGQLLLHAVVFPLLLLSSVDPVSRHGQRTEHCRPSHQHSQDIAVPHARTDGMQQQKMIQQLSAVQSRSQIQQPLSVQQGEQQQYHTGHQGDVEETGFVNAKEKEFCQKHTCTDIFIQHFRADSSDVKPPHNKTARRHHGNRPQFP